ncbi:MAG: hypothetical protein ABSE62_16125 [Chthoniobacteraceae bacterium]
MSGQVIKQGGSIGGVSIDAVPPALLYDIGFTGSGTPTGTFVYITATNTLAATLLQMGIASQPLINITGKLPHTICDKDLLNFLNGVPLTSSTTGNVTIKAFVKLTIDKKGFVHASASRFSFSARGQDNQRILFTGTFTIASGAGLTVVPSAATGDGSATPTIIFPQGPFENSTEGASGLTTQQYVRIGRDASRTEFFILKNDGPNTDNFTLTGQLPNPLPGGTSKHPWFSATVYDGNTNITTSVFDVHTGGFETPGTGYSIPDIPSGGTKLIKAVIHVGSAPPNSYGEIGFVLESATAGAESAIGQYEVAVP